MLREAESQYLSSIKLQPTVNSYLELSNVYVRLDLPQSSITKLLEARLLFIYID